MPGLPLSDHMLKRIILAAPLALVGSVFLLQGIGLLGGSRMTGDPTWAIVGTAMLAAAVLLAWSAYRPRSRAARARDTTHRD